MLLAVEEQAADSVVVLRSTPPPCPLHGSTATIVRHGSYATPSGGPRRQRYRCRPDNLEERARLKTGFHWFTPKLAREHVHVGKVHCSACGEPRGVHKGDPVVARAQTWNLRVVAEGLSKVAAGESYSAVGRWAWEVTSRKRTRAARLSDAERARRLGCR